MVSREDKLKRAILPVKDDYHFVIIDCPPSLGLLTLNALNAANGVLIPIQCEYYALEGLGQLMNTITLVRKHLNAELRIEGVVLTMYDTRTNLSEQVADEVRNYFKQYVYSTVIPRNVRLSEAPSYGQHILEYDPRSRGAELHLALAREVIKR
jgi:chromosome partitioning protein